MSYVSREKIALVVFVALIAISLFGLLGYLAIGHSWNVAASNIDDATGRMDGYTAIVFEGTVDPTLAKEDTDSAVENKQLNSSGAKDANKQSGIDESEMPSAASGGSSANNDSASSGGTGASGVSGETGRSSTNNGLGTTGGSATNSDSEAANGLDALGESEESPDSSGGSGLSASAKKKIPIDLLDVEESYLEKNATVFTLDTLNLGKYSEGTILRKGDHRFGVFSIDAKTTARFVTRMVEYFQAHEVDFIVVLTPDKALVEDSEGMDIVISTQDEGLFVMGETIQGTFYVNAPSLGSAGVILISPSNVVSAKVIQPE